MRSFAAIFSDFRAFLEFGIAIALRYERTQRRDLASGIGDFYRDLSKQL